MRLRPSCPRRRPGWATSRPRSRTSRRRRRRPRDRIAGLQSAVQDLAVQQFINAGETTFFADDDINRQVRADALADYVQQDNSDAIDDFIALQEDLDATEASLQAKKGEQADTVESLKDERAKLDAEASAARGDRTATEGRGGAEGGRRSGRGQAGADRRRRLCAGTGSRERRSDHCANRRQLQRHRVSGPGSGGLQRLVGCVPVGRSSPSGCRHDVAPRHAGRRPGKRSGRAPRQQHRRSVVPPLRRQRPLLLRHPSQRLRESGCRACRGRHAGRLRGRLGQRQGRARTCTSRSTPTTARR